VPLTETDRDRLIKLLGMTGSDADGEVVNAARLANRLLRERQETWEAALTPKPIVVYPTHSPPPRPRPRPRGRTDTPWAAMCRIMLWQYDELLNDWERMFLGSIMQQASLSEKQRAVLTKIATKCGISAAAA